MALKMQFTVDEIKKTVSYLRPIFDVVRLVDPEETAVIEFDNQNKAHKSRYNCYDVWNKNERCRNCTSLCAGRTMCEATKYEVMKNNVFYIVSKPIKLTETNLEHDTIVLEIVSRISNHLTIAENGEKSIAEIITETDKKIYCDELTGAYNRRYFNEHIFIHTKSSSNVKKAAFVTLDLNRFKRINDEMGHAVGDWVLQEVVKTLKNNCRVVDSVVRMGGDEMLVVLLDIEESDIKKKIKSFDEEIKKICYDKENKSYVAADFGYAYTDNFIPSEAVVNKMLDDADKIMYEQKKKRKID